ncbi:MAG: HEAT repeat domain-containing protein [Pirellulales bacterium]|nr:HEAT repeat domain-containing protein [Pirellulales bacterium]
MDVPKLILTYGLICFFLGCLPASLVAQQPPPAEGSEEALITVLESNASLFDKAKACQQLATVGTKACVPTLVKLLAQEQLSHYARYALEPIPDQSVDVALRGALGQLEGWHLVGVIQSIGTRRDVNATTDLEKFLGHANPEVAAAAASALGRIGSPSAANILKTAMQDSDTAGPAIADACLTAADQFLAKGELQWARDLYDTLLEADLPKHFHIASMYGALKCRGSDDLKLMIEQLQSEDLDFFQVALSMAYELQGDNVTSALIHEIPKLQSKSEPSFKKFVILKAEYGADTTWRDVTKQVTDAVVGDSISIAADNQLAGDPIPNVEKKLRVEYTLDGLLHTKSVPEGMILEIQPDPHPDVRQALLIYALGVRGDRAALPAILELARTGPAESRLAAVRALAKLGDVTAVPMLLEIAIATQGEIAAESRTSLANMAGEPIDTLLSDQLATSEGPERLLLIELAGRRGITTAAGHLIQLTRHDDPAVRIAAMDALGTTIQLDQLNVLIDQLIHPQSPSIANAASEALRKACLRMPDRDACAMEFLRRLPSAPTDAQKTILTLLGVVGGPKALAGVAAAAKGDDSALHDRATEVLGKWASPDAAPVLLELANADHYSYRHRTLRGYISVARRFDYSGVQRIAMCQHALDAATRDDEKKLVFDVLKEKVPSPESLAIVVSYLKQDSLKDDACAAAVAIAEEIAPRDPKSAQDALQQVLEATNNQDITAQAKKLLDQIGR